MKVCGRDGQSTRLPAAPGSDPRAWPGALTTGSRAVEVLSHPALDMVWASYTLTWRPQTSFTHQNPAAGARNEDGKSKGRQHGMCKPTFAVDFRLPQGVDAAYLQHAGPQFVRGRTEPGREPSQRKRRAAMQRPSPKLPVTPPKDFSKSSDFANHLSEAVLFILDA
jgi:hypothetical protein